MLRSNKLANALFWAVFVVSATLVPHLLYSHLGFNPTDDGVAGT